MYELMRFRSEGWAARTVAGLAAFAEEHAAELRAATRAGRFPRELFAEMGRSGWVGPIVPEEHGGIGGGAAEYCLIAEEVGRHALVSPQISVQGQRWLLVWGTDEQKARYLRPMATGELIFSESISEPGVGSSFKEMRATAERDGDDWILTGRKTHVNLGAACDLTIFYAMAEEGLTSFLVDMDLPGVSTRQTDPIGLRLIPTADVDLDRVRVPSSALLGAPGQGLETFLATFNLSRLGNASELLGFARRALVLGLDYARARRVGDAFVTDFQGIQWTVADVWAQLHAAALARDHAAGVIDDGRDPAFATSVAKKLAVDAAERATNEVFALVGGHGLYREQEFAQLLDDVKVLRIAGGSVEILRNYLSRRILRDEGYEGLR
jgi:alkylation response protein AidB-like acyl-CoA dehydrogenase